jgi:hypothetical protein
MSLALRSLGLSLACLGLSFACATAQDDPFLQGTGGRIDTAGKGGGGAVSGSAGQTTGGSTGKGGSSGKGGAGGSAGTAGKGGSGGTGDGGDPGSSGADAGGVGGAPGPDPCAPEGTPPEVHIRLKNGSATATTDPTGEFHLVNGTEDEVPLSELTFRYYFTSEFDCADTLANTAVNISHFQLDNPYAARMNSYVTTSVVELEEHGRYCDAYFEIGFTEDAGALEPEQTAFVGIWTQIAIFNGTAHDQSNDYSFGACLTSEVWWDKLTVYRDGTKISGTPPENDSGEGGAGGQGGAGGEGGLSGGEGGLAGAGGEGGLAGAGGEGGLTGSGGALNEGGSGGEPAGGAPGAGGAPLATEP